MNDQVQLLLGDCIDVMWTIDDNTVDAVITDPPYGIGFMGKAWDGAAIRDAAQRDRETRTSLGPSSDSRPGRATPRSSSAFGNEAILAGPVRGGRDFQDWCAAWSAECLRVLKPGGHLLAFGGSRTWHRLAVGVEDAGFEIRDSIAWLYGSGFPKSLNVSKAIDKRKIGSDQVAAFKRDLAAAVAASGKTRTQINAECGFTMRFDISFDRDPQGWGCSLPTPEQYDVICRVLAVDGNANVEQLRAWPRTSMEKLYTVVGYERRLNSPSGIVSVGRESIAVERELTEPGTDAAKQWDGWGTALKPAFEPIVVARKPIRGSVSSNVLVHGTGALNIDGCRVGDGADSQGRRAEHESSRDRRYTDSGAVDIAATPGTRGGSPIGRWPTNVVLDDASAATLAAGKIFPTFRYTPKASTAERPSADGTAHPTVKPRELMGWLIRLVTPPGGLVLDPFAGSGTTIEAALREGKRAIGIERDADYIALIHDRLSRTQHGFDLGVS